MAEETKVAPTEGAPEKNSAPGAKASKPVSAKATPEKGDKPAPKKQKKFNNPFSDKDPLQSKFINCLMKDGKKSIARRILADTFQELHRKGESDPLKTFELALKNATPTMEAKGKRIGGAVYQIPVEVPQKRQQSLCIRWILAGARKKKGQPMYKRLAGELLDSASEQGFAHGKREEAHRIAAANKAFAHLARY